MGREMTYESILADLDGILTLTPTSLRSISSRLRTLDQKLERLLVAARIDEARRRALFGVVTSIRASSAELARSLGNAKRGGRMRDDWTRLAQRDFAVLKEELLALREQIVVEADFIRFACLREHIGEIGGTNPTRLFEELHEAGAISERTWLLLMARPDSWHEALKDKEVSKQLSQISTWLLDLQEARGKREALEKDGGNPSEHFQDKG